MTVRAGAGGVMSANVVKPAEAAAAAEEEPVTPPAALSENQTQKDPQAALTGNQTQKDPQAAMTENQTQKDPQAALTGNQTQKDPQAALTENQTQKDPQAALTGNQTQKDPPAASEEGRTLLREWAPLHHLTLQVPAKYQVRPWLVLTHGVPGRPEVRGAQRRSQGWLEADSSLDRRLMECCSYQLRKFHYLVFPVSLDHCRNRPWPLSDSRPMKGLRWKAADRNAPVASPLPFLLLPAWMLRYSLDSVLAWMSRY